MEQHFLRPVTKFHRRSQSEFVDLLYLHCTFDPESGPEQDHTTAAATELPELFPHNRMQIKEIRHNNRLIGGMSQFVLFSLHRAEPSHVIFRAELKFHMLTDQMQRKF